MLIIFLALPSNSAATSGRIDRAPYGIGLVLLAYGIFSCVDPSAKWLVLFGYPALQLAFMRYAVALAISGGRVWRADRGRTILRGGHTGLLILRGAFLLAGTVGNFIALKYIPLTLTSTIFFSAPIIVCLLSGVVLGEPVGRRHWLAIWLGFVGILIAIRPFGAGFHWAALVSLAGVGGFALYLLLTRRFAGVESPDTMQFYSGLVGTLSMLPFAIYFWQWPESALHWALLIGLGVFAWGGHEVLIRAYRYADASVLTPYSYSFMIYLSAWSIILFDQYPDRWTLAGAALIVASGLIIWAQESNRRRNLSATLSG